MNIKVIAGLILCIGLIIMTAGCTALVPESPAPIATKDVWASESSRTAYAMGAPMPVPTSVPVARYEQSPGGNGADTKIIKTGSVTLEVKDIPGSVAQLKTIAESKGGFLSSSNMQKGYNDRLSANVVVRVPAKEFDSTLTAVKALGTVQYESASNEDVTEDYVDLTAQKTSYQNQLAQYNEIMKKSEKIEDIIKVQEQIDRVQTELNRLEGRLQYLDNRIDISTINVNLQEPEPVGGESGHNFVTTLNEGIAGFLGMIDVLIILVLTLLPLIILGGAAYGIYRWRKGKKPVAAPVEAIEKK